MTADVPVVPESVLLSDVHKLLRDGARNYTTINYIYVVDAGRKLLGVLSVRDLFTHDQTSTAGEVCIRSPLFTVHPETHQERAAYLALRHGIKAIPVVDRGHVFIGEIAADTVLSILHKEMREDSFRRAGIRHPDAAPANVLDVSVFMSIRHRLPWLVIGLLGGLLAARVIGFFQDTLSKNLILAAFIPLIVYISDAVGTQMEAYIIRDLAIEHSIPFARYFLKHLIVVIAIGALLAVLLLGSYGFFYDDWHIAGVLSLSLFAAVLSSVLTGLMIPYIFSRFSLDPADASGPVATIVQDILSIVIYFMIATALL